MREHRAVQDVPQASLEVTVHVRQREDALVFLQRDVAVLLQDDVIHRQRAGLVGAEHVHRAQVLNGVDPLDDDLLAAHRQCAFGQAHRHDHRQHLRSQAHGHRDGEEEGFDPVALGQTIDDEDEGHHGENESQHQPGELSDALVERRLCRHLRQRLGHAAEKCLFPGGDDNRRRRTAFDARAQECDGGQIDGRSRGRVPFDLELLNREALAGQRALRDEQIFRRDHAHVGGDHVPCGQFHDVTGDQLRNGDLLGLAIADRGGGDRDHGLELGRRAVGLGFLDEFQAHAQSDHERHHDARPRVTGGE